MRRFAIFGAGINGVWLKRFLEHKVIPIQDDCEVCYFIDNNKNRGSYVEGVEILSPYDLNKYQHLEIIISSAKIVDDAMRQLREIGVKNKVFFTPNYVYKFRYSNQMEEKILPVLVSLDIFKPRLPYLEYSIVGHCNLNCRGCNALVNDKDEEFSSLDSYEKDFIRLREIFAGIKYLKIFGGEPLLHPQWTDFVKLSRKHFPDSELVVHSNGVLIPQLESKELSVMREMNAGFVFTLYPATGIIKETIEKKLQKENISYSFTEPVYTFLKVIRKDGGYDQEDVFKHCFNCVNLIKGTLSCEIGHLVADLEKKFNVEICKDDYKWEHCVNIYTTKLNGDEINQLLRTSSKLCSYCGLVGGYFSMRDEDVGGYPWKGGCKECRLEDYLM